MMNRTGAIALLVSVVFMLTSCMSVLEAKKTPGADLRPIKSIYVQTFVGDEHGIDQLIGTQLARMGFTATIGRGEAPLSPTDAILTYKDEWVWDITYYMLQLSIYLRDSETRGVLASGRVLYSSVIRESPDRMVMQVLAEIFKGERN